MHGRFSATQQESGGRPIPITSAAKGKHRSIHQLFTPYASCSVPGFLPENVQVRFPPELSKAQEFSGPWEAQPNQLLALAMTVGL